MQNPDTLRNILCVTKFDDFLQAHIKRLNKQFIVCGLRIGNSDKGSKAVLQPIANGVRPGNKTIRCNAFDPLCIEYKRMAAVVQRVYQAIDMAYGSL